MVPVAVGTGGEKDCAVGRCRPDGIDKGGIVPDKAVRAEVSPLDIIDSDRENDKVGAKEGHVPFEVFAV